MLLVLGLSACGYQQPPPVVPATAVNKPVRRVARAAPIPLPPPPSPNLDDTRYGAQIPAVIVRPEPDALAELKVHPYRGFP